jgi:hypothetical protein
MLDPSALTRVPGLDVQRPNGGFGDWKCRWHSTVGKAAVILRFYQREPLGTDAGRPRQLAGRPAFVTPGASDQNMCTVRVVHRTYPDVLTQPIVELVQIEVYAPESEERLCALADELGTAMVGRLPKG